MYKLRNSLLLSALALAMAPALADSIVLRDSGASVVEVPHAVAQVQDAIAKVTQNNAQGAMVKTFRYRDDQVYKILLKPGKFTAFSIPRDEPIKDFAFDVPDAVEVKVNPETNVGLVKLVTATTLEGTIVTDKHVYYLAVTPAIDGEWYQGVKWNFETAASSNSFGYHAPVTKVSATTSPAPSEDDRYGHADLNDGLTGHPNFNYRLDGDATIKPVSVWDNGKWTWIQFDNATQSIPAVFFVGADGPEVVNYTVQPDGKQILVNRLMSKFMLRLGNQKVLVTAK